MLTGDWQLEDGGEMPVAAAAAGAASSCGDVGLQPWPIGLPDWLELRGLRAEKFGVGGRF